MSVVPAARVPSRLTRLVPRLVTGLGVIHLVYAVVESPGVLRAMAVDGVLGASDDYQRDYVTWFLVAGFALLLTGGVMRWAVRRTGELPPSVGWWLLGIGVFDVVLEPTGGSWALALLGALTAYATLRDQRVAHNPSSSSLVRR